MADPVRMDNRLVAVAARGGRFAAAADVPVTSCPYTGADAKSSALRRMWLVSYLRVRPPKPDAVSYDGDGADKVAAATAGPDVSPQRLAKVPAEKLAAGLAKLADQHEWDTFPAVEKELTRREQDANHADGWAADASDKDWRVDAMLARGADVAEAFAAVYGRSAADEAALRRGYELWAAERALVGEPAGTLEEFRAQVRH